MLDEKDNAISQGPGFRTFSSESATSSNSSGNANKRNSNNLGAVLGRLTAFSAEAIQNFGMIPASGGSRRSSGAESPSIISTSIPSHEVGRSKLAERIAENMENVNKCKLNIRNDIGSLLRAIAACDQVTMASRKAAQSLDKECKHMVSIALRALIRREKESLQARAAALEKLEAAVEDVDPDADETDFITKFRTDKGSLYLSSQALSIISDQDWASTNPAKRQYQLDEGPPSPSNGSSKSQSTIDAQALSASNHARPTAQSLISTHIDDLESEIITSAKSNLNSSFHVLTSSADPSSVSSPVVTTVDDEISSCLHKIFYLDASDTNGGSVSDAAESGSDEAIHVQLLPREMLQYCSTVTDIKLSADIANHLEATSENSEALGSLRRGSSKREGKRFSLY